MSDWTGYVFVKPDLTAFNRSIANLIKAVDRMRATRAAHRLARTAPGNPKLHSFTPDFDLACHCGFGPAEHERNRG